MDETKKRILIVDDDHANIEALVTILKAEYDLYIAKDGSDAIETAQTRPPDIILLDIVMPGMDGFEVLSALKNCDTTSAIPVIFITSLRNADNERKGLVLGAADYITKPFSSAIVELRVKNQVKILDQLRLIEQLSMTDQLTGVPNRRNFESRFQTEWNRAMREQTPISLLLIDLDNFKKYNDTYGHQQGDIALQTFVQVLAAELKRPSDFYARWGGEEFIALLPNTDSRGALHVAKRIRQRVENMEIPCPHPAGISITASVGVNTHIYGDSDSETEFFAGADEALYIAKDAGRNMVHLLEKKRY